LYWFLGTHSYEKRQPWFTPTPPVRGQLSVNLAKHNVLRANNRGHIRQQVAI
jgi:hypothetical protein